MEKGPLISRHNVTVTYLEQLAKPSVPQLAVPPEKMAIMRVREPSLSFYRYLFNTVGEAHKWISRRYISDEDLAALVHADTCEIYVLYKDGWPAGFAEFNTAPSDHLEFKFFGLVPEAQGMRLGPWFLQEMVNLAWSKGPERMIIETCTLDSPAALRLYQRAGFTVYAQAEGLVEWHG